MPYLARFSPIRAINDLRGFLAQREPHELWFGLLAIALTSLMLVGFWIDAQVEQPAPRRQIIFVEQWPLSRTDREIIAQQKIDQVARDKRDAEIRRARLEHQRQLKRLDDRLEALGF